jgi:RNA polymerase sigma-70 factor (ECF subfamily)
MNVFREGRRLRSLEVAREEDPDHVHATSRSSPTAAWRPTAAAPAPALVAGCVAGSDAAWRDLHGEYQPVAAAFLRKMGVREPDLEDALQNVFVQLVRYLPGFRGEAAFKTWLYRLCLTEAKETRRRARLMTALRALLKLERPAPAAAGLEFGPDAARRRVEAALQTLKPHERSVFVLYEMEGLSGEQIAEIEGCPVATVWRRLHYARAAFRTSVEDGPALSAPPATEARR